MGTEGYVAIVNQIEDSSFDDSSKASPIYQIIRDVVSVVQQFAVPNQNRVYLRYVLLNKKQSFQFLMNDSHQSRIE